MAAAHGGDAAAPEQPPGAEPAEDFVYSEEELAVPGPAWADGPAAADEPGAAAAYPESRFDRALLQGWRRRMELGLFRYRLDELPTRVLPGPLRLVAQLNPQRAALKRGAQPVRSLAQPFDPRHFNFTQIRPGEVLFRLRRAPARRPPFEHVLVVINVSPLERGHVLLLPEPALRLPQRLPAELLLAGLDAVLLSAHPGFRVGFNSLGAFASVNHLHLHGFYTRRPLPVDAAPAEPLAPARGLFLLRRAPAPAFLFFSAGRARAALARDVCRAAGLLLARGLAYNVLATRGAAPAGGPAGLRVLLWARRAALGAAAQAAPPVALCELAGLLPLGDAAAFCALTEEEALSAIRQHLLPDAQLEQLGRDLVRLLHE